MEQSFQTLLLTGKFAVSDDNFSPPGNSETIPTLNHEQSILPSLHHPYDYLYGHPQITYTSIDTETQTLKKPKVEHSFTFNPSMFFTNHLPNLQSLEQQQSISLTNFQFTPNYFTPSPPPPPPPPLLPLQRFRTPEEISYTERARRKRNTLSEKARLLQKVLPFDKKMDMATVYEESYKYIKFLKAQIEVLESMPVVVSSCGSNFGSRNPNCDDVYGGLGKLNRQQLLEVLVNSPSAQAILYSKGCCVYSLEQLVLLKDIAEKNFNITTDHTLYY